MRKSKAAPRRTVVLVVAFLVCAVVFGVMVARRYQQSQLPPPALTEQPPASSRIVTLFFALPDADGLVREGREIGVCGDPAECVQALLQELQNGPVGEYEAILPESAPLPTATVSGDLAVIDLSTELVAELPGGSATELATVYGLVDTVTVNFPAIKRVQLLIAGKKVETLKGHIDISAPLGQDLTHERKSDTKPPGAAPGGTGAPR